MSTADNELTQLEKQYWQALKDKDAKACAELCDDPSLVAGAQGVSSITKEQMAAMVQQGGRYLLEEYELKDMRSRMLGLDVGCVAYTVHEKLTVDGKSVSFTAADTSVWVKRGAKWLCAMHTESIHGDPFGRDRTEMRQQ